jgi:hypothetical protein
VFGLAAAFEEPGKLQKLSQLNRVRANLDFFSGGGLGGGFGSAHVPSTQALPQDGEPENARVCLAARKCL